MLPGFRALAARGLAVEDGEPLTERARAVKGPDEIRAMRCALHACEAAMAEMRAAARPGLSEDEIWSHLHAGNIRRGGEWIETRLLASGPRTNPWFQECGPRIVQPDEILAFDTDLSAPTATAPTSPAPGGSATAPPRPDMRADHALACEQIAANTALLRPGTSFADLHDRAFVLPEPYRAQRYSCIFHGVGLCDEWPYITYPEDRARRLRGRPRARHGPLRREPDQPRRRRLLDQARGAGAGDRDGAGSVVALPARPHVSIVALRALHRGSDDDARR